jgi:hypothetical protein
MMPTQKRVLKFDQIEIENIEGPYGGERGSKIFVPIISGSVFGSVIHQERIELTPFVAATIQTWAIFAGIWFRSMPRDFFQTLNTLSSENFEKLTVRQKSIFLQMREGQTNLTIAKSLGYSESLVKAESVKIFRGLEISGRQDPLFGSELS